MDRVFTFNIHRGIGLGDAPLTFDFARKEDFGATKRYSRDVDSEVYPIRLVGGVSSGSMEVTIEGALAYAGDYQTEDFPF